ncbi:DUF4253 domain-containing protein [Actinoplanes sp. NPDC051343]|uniref:DUF4253 domain-containing protein n=1 Tax=Actinoplanes sp. NPDC051343 TaxID=3363906 RepID=UPI0037AF9911
MIEDADGMVEALSQTALAGFPVDDAPGGTLVVPDIDPAGLLEAWQAARSVVPATGRWPVMITAEDEILDGEDPSDFDDLDLAARKIDPWKPPWRVINDDEPLIPATDLDGRLRGFPADLIEAATNELAMPSTEPALGRWIYDRLLADPTLAAALQPQVDAMIGTQYWFVPQTVQLVLLPTPLPWLAPYWFDYWGTQDSTWLSAVERNWHHRWGAELVASWGTMLQFLASRQPEPGEQAWELAGQLKKVGTSLQMDQWLLALALPHTDAWFLHDRP